MMNLKQEDKKKKLEVYQKHLLFYVFLFFRCSFHLFTFWLQCLSKMRNFVITLIFNMATVQIAVCQ